ncbi:MAG: PAS domain S-box protein [Pseudomonadota bacterium]
MTCDTRLKNSVGQQSLQRRKSPEPETPGGRPAAGNGWRALAKCLAALGGDHHGNIVGLTALCGEFVDADFARYSRIESGSPITVAVWSAPGDDPPDWEPPQTFGFEEISRSDEDFLVLHHHSHASRSGSDPLVPNRDFLTCSITSVKAGTQVAGCLAVFSRSERAPVGEDREFMRAVASAVGSEERRREFEDAARRDRKMLKNILRASPAGIGYFEEGKLKWANPEMARMFGADLETGELGQSPREFFSSDAEFRRVRQEFYRILENREPAEGEALLRRMDGTTFHGRLKVSAVDPGHPGRGTITTISDISLRNSAEKALRESEERYRLLAENSLTGIYIHQDGRFEYVNNRLAEMLGYTAEELIGRYFWDFVHPEDLDLVKARGLARSKGLEVSPHYEFRVLNRFGETKVFEVMATTIVHRGRSANMGNVADITERKKAEEELRTSREDLKEAYEKTREAEDLYRSLLDSSPAAIVIYDLEGRARFINDSFVRIFGWSREEIIGKRVPFLPDSEKEASLRHIRNLIDHGISAGGFETKRYTKDGSLVDVAITASRYHDHRGNPAGLLVILTDISARKRAEELLLQAERLKALGELASGVAHNFNNLLQIVVSTAQTALFNIQSGNLDDACHKLGIILKSSEFGSQTVKRLHDFSRISIAGTDTCGIVFDLSQTSRNAVEMMQPRLETKLENEGIEVVLQTDLSGICPVRGDESEILEVLINLIKNAFEALPHGGVIRVSCSSLGEEVLLTVQDNGTGISHDDLERIFDPFWTSKEFQAAGLGLAGCLGIVRHHRGAITVQSEQGRGSTFTLRLPRAENAAADREPPCEMPCTAGLRLLLIDDMESVVTMLGEGLEELGQVVHTATSGKQGMRIYSETPIDVVICDLGMPEMDGWEVGGSIKEICREKGIPKTPFILLTGWGDQLDLPDRMTAAGVDLVMGKPVVFLDLLRAVRDLTGRDAGPPIK